MEKSDARMIQRVKAFDIYRDDFAVAEEIAKVGEKDRGAAAIRTGFDDPARSYPGDDFLTAPNVENVLPDRHAHPSDMGEVFGMSHDLRRSLIGKGAFH